MIKKITAALFIIMISVMQLVYADANQNNANSIAAMTLRLMPYAQVDILGQTKLATVSARNALLPERSGKEVFEQVCITCHGTGAAGSPRFGCASAWAPRIAQGMAKLREHAMEGLNFMPPRGSCTDCSDQEIEKAIQYMVDNSKTGNACHD